MVSDLSLEKKKGGWMEEEAEGKGAGLTQCRQALDKFSRD